MRALIGIAAASVLGGTGGPWSSFDEPRFIHYAMDPRDHFTSERPLTKRQKRRLRGKAHP